MWSSVRCGMLLLPCGQEGGGEWRSTLHTVLGDLPLYLEPSVAGRRGPDAVR